MHIEEKNIRTFRIVSKLHKIPMNVVGGYQIGQKIGTGGFAKVYKAQHISSQKVVAAKIIDIENLSEDQIMKIKREIQIHSMLKHPNIVRIYGVCQQNNKIYIFMEYIEKGELFDYINHNGPLPQNFALRIFQQILSAVCYLHQNNIVHRDIKTQNIVLDSHLNAKLIDFGLAKRYDEQSPMLHRQQTICGSPSYCAPQIVKRKKDYNGKQVDVWCLGIVLYAMVEACLPFDQNDCNMLKKNIVNFRYHRPRFCSDECSQLFELIFRQSDERPTCKNLMNSKILIKYLLSYNDTICSTPKKHCKQTYSLSHSRRKYRIQQVSCQRKKLKSINQKKSSFIHKSHHHKYKQIDDIVNHKLGDMDNIFVAMHKKNGRPNPLCIQKARLRDQSPDSPKRILDCVKGYK